ncbi:MAG: cytochrome c-type biogenesis protein CcmH [Alphaproteobacteria bacterium]|nr:cytochrome c-type biogenesis protein CcmH [Alphaproteobacteria bacterium]
MIRVLAVVLLALAGAVPAGALEPGERLADPALEARAREIGKTLRCLVCQNQSIDDSDADLARDLRAVVRERLSAGETDRQVVAYVRDRYGDFVLLKPPFQPSTYALWAAPVVLFGLAALTVVVVLRRRRGAADVARLSAEEEARLARLLDDGRR